jgi:hypothetical protein
MGSGNKKEAENLKKIAQMIGCDGGIIVFGLEYPIPNTVSNLEKENKELYKIMESEDLLQIGNIIDNKEALEEKGKFKEMYLQFPLADESDLESVVETKKVQKKDEVIEKKIEPVKEEVQSIDYSYLLDRGFINDRAYMQSVIFNSKLIINGLTDDERQKIISKLQLHKDNKLISIKELESKNLINDNIYMKKLINDPKVIIIGLSDELKNKINNYVEKKIENKVSSDDDLKKLAEKLGLDVLDSKIQPLNREDLKNKEKKIEEQQQKASEKSLNTESLLKIRERMKQEILAKKNEEEKSLN